MHNIIYRSGIVESELLQVVNIHRPFHSKVDKIKRKASLSKLIVSPDETRNSPQIKRFLVSVGNRFAWKLHVTYRGNLKCHNIYDTNSSVDKILRTSVIKTLIDNVDVYPNLKHDLLSIIRVIVKSWHFDCIITDIPWLEGNYTIPVMVKDWSLLSYAKDKPYGKGMNLLLKQYGKVPMNILPYYCLENLELSETDIEYPDYLCPLYIMKSNSFYAGYLAKVFNKGLPVAIFKTLGKVF